MAIDMDKKTVIKAMCPQVGLQEFQRLPKSPPSAKQNVLNALLKVADEGINPYVVPIIIDAGVLINNLGFHSGRAIISHVSWI